MNSVTKINIRGGNKPWSQPESFLCLSTSYIYQWRMQRADVHKIA